MPNPHLRLQRHFWHLSPICSPTSECQPSNSEQLNANALLLGRNTYRIFNTGSHKSGSCNVGSNPAAGNNHSGPSVIAVTGASSGIGLEFVRQYAAAGCTVIALCRSPTTAGRLNEAVAAHTSAEGSQCQNAVRVIAYDQSSADGVAGAVDELAGQRIDTLICNAGVGGSGNGFSEFGQDGQQLGSIDYEAWEHVMQVNVMGTLRTVEALLPNLLLGAQPRLVFISGVFGSITNQVRVGEESPDVPDRKGSAGYILYRSSKAALNMVAKLVDVDVTNHCQLFYSCLLHVLVVT